MRKHYLKRYAKDTQGNYISTERPAPDAGLVFVPGKSTDQELLEQVRKVAFGKEYSNQYHMVSVRDSLFLKHVLSSSRMAGQLRKPVEGRFECEVPEAEADSAPCASFEEEEWMLSSADLSS